MKKARARNKRQLISYQTASSNRLGNQIPKGVVQHSLIFNNVNDVEGLNSAKFFGQVNGKACLLCLYICFISVSDKC